MFTEKTCRNTQLVECLETQFLLKVQCKMWLKTFNTVLYKCFKKIRIVPNDKKNSPKGYLIDERNELKKEIKSVEISEQMKMKIENRI